MRNIYFLLLPNLVLVDFAAPADSFRIANQYGADFDLHFIAPSLTNDTISCSLGINLLGVKSLPSLIPDGSIIVIPGSNDLPHNISNKSIGEAASWLKSIVTNKKVMLVCICSAAFLAAKSGFLEYKNCTTHHTLVELLKEQYPNAKVLEDRVYVQDDQLFTSAGVTSSVDLTLHIIELFTSPKIAQSVAKDMIVYFKRTDKDEQLSPWIKYRNHIHGRIHKLQDLIIDNPKKTYSLEQLAERASMSSRHLTRVFKENTGISVIDYQKKIKLSTFKRVISNPSISIENAAIEAGFASVQQLNRAWKKLETVSIKDLKKNLITLN